MAPKNKGKKGKKQDDDDFWCVRALYSANALFTLLILDLGRTLARPSQITTPALLRMLGLRPMMSFSQRRRLDSLHSQPSAETMVMRRLTRMRTLVV